VNQSFAKALERSIGVIVGVVIAVLLSLLLGAQSWVVLLAIVVAMLVTWAFRASPGTGNQVAISAMLVLALGSSNPEYAIDRILETLIGVAFALIVNALIVPPVLTAPARRDLGLLGCKGSWSRPACFGRCRRRPKHPSLRVRNPSRSTRAEQPEARSPTCARCSTRSHQSSPR
jgi:hypothetical protein